MGLNGRDQQIERRNVYGMMMQPGLPDVKRLGAIRKGDTSIKIGQQVKSKEGTATATKNATPTGVEEIERSVNEYAGKLIKAYLEKHTMDSSSVKITPFKIKTSSKKGGGIIGVGINQSAQERDFEAWAGPANFVLNWM